MTLFREVLASGLGAFRKGKFLAPHMSKALSNARRCDTPAMGIHTYVCEGCGTPSYSYDKCRSRYCPHCQASTGARWAAKQKGYALDVPYFHVVFTVPEGLRELALSHQREFYSSMLAASAGAVKELLAPYGQAGFTSVLQTWTKSLNFHPHIHMILPAGGWDGKSGTFKDAYTRLKSGGYYLFSFGRLSSLFRGKMLASLKSKGLLSPLPADVREDAYHRDWNVYVKDVVVGDVIEYLARYTYSTAVIERNIVSLEDHTVRYRYLDRKSSAYKVLEVTDTEFIRRFCLHVLPAGFTRIRHYGFLASGGKAGRIEAIRSAIREQGTGITAAQGSDGKGEAARYSSEAVLNFVRKCPLCGGNIVRADCHALLDAG